MNEEKMVDEEEAIYPIKPCIIIWEASDELHEYITNEKQPIHIRLYRGDRQIGRFEFDQEGFDSVAGIGIRPGVHR